MSEKKVIFISDDFGPTKLFDGKGEIAVFENTHSNIIEVDGVKKHHGRSVWFVVLSDPDKIERMRKYPGYGRLFKETDSMPVIKSLSTLKTLSDPNAYHPENRNSDGIETAVNEAKTSLKAKMKRFAELQPLVKKQDGGFKQNADPVLVEEFKNLSEELEIDD